MIDKKTKIVATISDRRCSEEFIRDLYEAGVNVVRINSAHVTPESAQKVVDTVRRVSDRIALLIDTKGPEIRVTGLDSSFEAGIPVKSGDRILIRGTADNTPSTRDMLYVNDATIFDDVPQGASLLIDDGDIELRVKTKHDDILECEVMNPGTIKGRKSVNVPNVSIHLPSVTDRDRQFIEWAIDQNLDFIAHSFVRKKEDVLEVQKILDRRHSTLKIISKIENREGVDNIDEILDVTYGIMVARGDLGVELPAEEIPPVQNKIVKKCIESKKPVIIATQMLHSMIHSPRPTRAEVSDVANAIYQRVDAIMLSGETANGDYPTEAVMTMSRVAQEIEKHTEPIIDINMVRINNEITAQLSRSAVRASINLPIRAIVIDTLTGRTGRYIAAFRGNKPVYAVCYRKHVMRELALSYGITAVSREPEVSHSRFLLSILDDLVEEKLLVREDLIAIVGGSFGPAQGASYMEIGQVTTLETRELCAR